MGKSAQQQEMHTAAQPRKKLKSVSRVLRAVKGKVLPRQRGYNRFVRLPAAEVPHAQECLISCLKYGGGGMDETMVSEQCWFLSEKPWDALRRFPESGTGKENRQEVMQSGASRHEETLAGGCCFFMAVPTAAPHRRTLHTWPSQRSWRDSLACQCCRLIIVWPSIILPSAEELPSCDPVPEHRCPAAVNDAIAALKWLVEYGPPPAGAPNGATAVQQTATEIFLSGDSAGGGLAFACALTAPAAVKPLLHGVAAISPWTDLTASSSTYETRLWDRKTRTGDPFDDRPGSLYMAATYIGSGANRFPPTDPRASPMFASPAQLQTLPPTLFVVGDYELGLGDSTEMRAKMVAAGHPDVSISVYDRMFHCHVLYAEGKETDQALRAAARGVREIAEWIVQRSVKKRSTH